MATDTQNVNGIGPVFEQVLFGCGIFGDHPPNQSFFYVALVTIIVLAGFGAHYRLEVIIVMTVSTHRAIFLNMFRVGEFHLTAVPGPIEFIRGSTLGCGFENNHFRNRLLGKRCAHGQPKKAYQ